MGRRGPRGPRERGAGSQVPWARERHSVARGGFVEVGPVPKQELAGQGERPVWPCLPGILLLRGVRGHLRACSAASALRAETGRPCGGRVHADKCCGEAEWRSRSPPGTSSRQRLPVTRGGEAPLSHTPTPAWGTVVSHLQLRTRRLRGDQKPTTGARPGSGRGPRGPVAPECPLTCRGPRYPPQPRRCRWEEVVTAART